MIKVLDLTKSFSGKAVLNKVSLLINRGEAAAIIGQSGAGKTTLFKALARSIAIDSGSIEINGSNVYAASYANLKKIRRSIGVIFQQHNLVKELSVAVNVAAGLFGAISTSAVLKTILFGPGAAMLKRCDECLNEVGLSDKIFQRAGTLSGGEQQRVAVARLLMQDPEIILADEPIASVDPVSAGHVMDALLRLVKSRGKTLICNLHDIDAAQRYFDRIIAIKHGEVIFDGSPADLTGDMLHLTYGEEIDNAALSVRHLDALADMVHTGSGHITKTLCELRGTCRR